jgi:hypothetical protein
MTTGIFENFHKVKNHHLASNSNFIFFEDVEIIIQAHFKEKIMDRISYLRYLWRI